MPFSLLVRIFMMIVHIKRCCSMSVAKEEIILILEVLKFVHFLSKESFIINIM